MRRFFLSLALLLVGCSGAPAPETAPPETGIDIPSRWSAGATQPTLPADADVLADPWWTRFPGAGLDALVREGLQRNLPLRTVAATYAEARARARIAGADRLPRVDVGGNAGARREIFVGLPIPGESGPLKAETEQFTTRLTVSWEADLWGRLRAGRRAAASDLATAAAELEAARLSTAAQIVRAVFEAREARLQVELAERDLESRRTTEERVTARYRAGVGSPLDVRLARSNLAQSVSALEARRRMAGAVRRDLEVLLGRYPAGSLDTGDALGDGLAPLSVAPLSVAPLPVALPAVLPAELITRRPDLRAAERRLAAAGWRVAEARRALYPRLSFTAGVGTTSDRVGDLLDGDFSIWNVVGNLLQPLFQGGRLRAAVELAEASRERVLADYVERALRAFAEVETALDAERFLAAEQAALTIALGEAEAAASLAENRYMAGIGDYLDILESRRQALSVESRLLAVHRQRLVHRVDLYVALGGDAFTALDSPAPPTDG